MRMDATVLIVEDSPSVFRARPHENVHVPGSAGHAVVGDGKSADHDELDLRIRKLQEKIAEVFVQITKRHYSGGTSPGRYKRAGKFSRS